MATELTESQLLESLMGAYDGLYTKQYALAQYNPDLLTTQKGYLKYREMLTMAACRAPFNIKRYAVLHKPWSVQAAVLDPNDSRHEEAKLYADTAQWALSNILDPATDEPQDFRSTLFEMLYACWVGFQVTEIQWRVLEDGPYKGKLGFKRFSAKPPQQIGFELDPDTLAVLAIKPFTLGGGYGPPVPPQKVLRYTYNPLDSLPYGEGDGRSVYKHWWRLDATLKFWGIATEVFGVPFILARYQTGNKIQLEAALTALNKIRQGAPAILPKDVDAEVITAGAGGAMDIFSRAADWDAQQCALTILGSTLTTGEGRRTGSLALGEVHQDTQKLTLEFVKEDLEGLITHQLLRRFMLYNFGPASMALCPRFSLGEWDEADRLKLAKMYDLLVRDRIVHRRAKFIREDLGLPALDPDEEALLDGEDAAESERQARAADARNTAPGASGSGLPATDDDTEEED